MSLRRMGQFYTHLATCRPSWNPEWTVLEITTSVGNNTCKFAYVEPLINGTQVLINWGDGTPDTPELAHTYLKNGSFLVIIKNCQHFRVTGYQGIYEKNSTITRALQCGNQITSCEFMLYLCVKLRALENTWHFPAEIDRRKGFQWVLGDCPELKKLPESLAIPRGVTDIMSFLGNSGVEYLPESFAILTDVLNFQWAFKNMPLKTLPQKFIISPRIQSLYATFKDCKNLSADLSDIIKENFTGSNINFGQAFWGCLKIYGRVPAEFLWLDKTPGRWGDTQDCFTGCDPDLITNYADIPKSWGGPHEEYN